MFLFVATLTPCLASIWLDGSPFQADYFSSNTHYNHTSQCESSNNSNTEPLEVNGISSYSYLSVGVMVAGIIAGKFGLWVSDLSITQTLQENVQEEHSNYNFLSIRFEKPKEATTCNMFLVL